MSKLTTLKKLETINDLAELLGYQPKAISYILFRDRNKYRTFDIPKKNGGVRVIQAPNDKLKLLQTRLALILSDCFDEINIVQGNLKSISHGFRINHSIETNAWEHKNKRYVFNLDLKDFFPSINFGRVRGFFIKNHHFNLSPTIATFIAQIACYENELPQGSPCSPIISNLIGNILDIRLVKLAKKNKCTYSRYADDLTFSTNNKNFPIEIAANVKEHEWVIGDKLRTQIDKVGFAVNDEKTHMQYKTSRQVTTGLIVNKRVNVKREYYKTARAFSHSLLNHDKYFIDKETEGSINQLEGILSFIYKIKRPYDQGNIGLRRHNPNGITQTYRNFLSFKHFIRMEKPLLIVEGKTDVTYIKYALKKHSSEYPNLVDVVGGKTIYKFNFLRFTKRLKDVFAISEGTPGLEAIIEMYDEWLLPYRGKLNNLPVILILDTDTGVKGIQAKIKKKHKKIGFKFPSINYTQNLFVNYISQDKDLEIEDLFDKTVLNTEVEGKKFSKQKDFDTTKFYGKHIFSEKVIKENYTRINFDGFKYLLGNIDSVIKDYKKS